jgi:hypothetical protein
LSLQTGSTQIMVSVTTSGLTALAASTVRAIQAVVES